jgi:thiol-disulfide isomerase/thioredoxin
MKKILLLIGLLVPFSVFAQLKVGTNAPELSLEGIYNREGNQIPTIESLRGKIIILDFWATWCAPCIAAFPETNELNLKYKDKNVQIIAITDDPKERLENLLDKMKVDFWIGRDDDKEAFNKYMVKGRPQLYIINKDGVIVYEGNKVAGAMIDEVLATNAVNLSKREEYTKIITSGSFTGGEDPLYNAVTKMLGKDRNFRPILIEQVIIRPSLESSFGGYVMRNSSDGHVGITYSGGDIKSIFQFLCNIFSPLRIKDNTKDTTRYDIIYWKKAEEKSVLKEIKQKLTDGLSITLDTIKTLQNVNILSTNDGNELLKKYSEIKDGTLKLYTPLSSYIYKLEVLSGKFYIGDESVKNKYVFKSYEDLKKLDSETKLLDFLKEGGITINQKTQTINLFEINKK